MSHGMTVREKQETVVCEIKEDAKSVGEKEEESTCVTEYQVNILNNQDNLPQIQHYLSPNEEIPEYLQYSEPFPAAI